ncbi:MAG TPA: helix-turn-helix domain-containing protein [Thermoplasmata archaeon]|nr:helix-turn-helix domain-containing protein [Thermoplasmata archaeon]
MPVVDARVRIHHPCPYCDISAEFPATLLLLWCDNRRDVFLVSSPDPAEQKQVLGALRDSFHARPLATDGNEALVAVPDFEWTTPPSVTSLARKTDVWVLHPVVYFGGTETYRFVAPSNGDLKGLIVRLRKLGDVEVLSVAGRASLGPVRDLPTASIHFFEGLTDQQARSLVAAYEGGLLHVPARSSWADVARRIGLSRSTFGEHLRKGQLRLLANSYASIKARADSASEPVNLPATGPRPRVQRTPLQGVRRSDRPDASE